MAWAILLLAHRQDIQAKAFQAIKDGGILDLPSSAYASTNVEYIHALSKEISRYFTVLKLALPKATYTDIRWEGAVIPADTLVFLNSWACNRGRVCPFSGNVGEDIVVVNKLTGSQADPTLFTNPDVFNPDRWLEGSADHHAHQFAFGIGGRMCVAALLAQNALYTVYLHLIAHFHILPADGATIDEIDPLKGLKGRTFVGTPRGSRAKFVPRDAEKLKRFLAESER